MQMPLVLTNRRRRGGSASAPAFSPSSLYSSGSQGIWLDPSDLSTMFSDRAGTTPVTAPGTVVGLRLDKSKGGVGTNGASRRNILSWSEGFNDSIWTKANVTVTADAAVAPDGTTTADALFETATTNAHNASQQAPVVAGSPYTFSVYAKPNGRDFLQIVPPAQVVASGYANFDIATGAVGNSGGTGLTSSISGPFNGFYRCSLSVASAASSLATASPTLGIVTAATSTRLLSYAGDITKGILVWGAQFEVYSAITAYQKTIADWASTMAGNHATAPTDAARPTYGIEPKTGRRNLLLATDTLATQSLTVTAVAHTLAFTGTGTVTLSGASIAGPLIGTGAGNRVSLTFTPTAASLTLTVVGSVTLGQLELGSSATAYQRVNSAYDVTEAGVATTHYVQYDGSDDSMSTAAIDFTATDKMSVFAGVRKLSDAARGIVVELSSIVTNPGAFAIYAPSGTATAAYLFGSGGSSAATATSPTSYAAPISNLLTGLGNISGDTATLRIDGAQVAQSTADQGTGNFGNYPLFFGRRNNATLPFNGRDYGIIVVGKAASAGEITDTETWLAAKTAQVTL